jgi:hypothetical protein
MIVSSFRISSYVRDRGGVRDGFRVMLCHGRRCHPQYRTSDPGPFNRTVPQLIGYSQVRSCREYPLSIALDPLLTHLGSLTPLGR